jgi:hypothetical protein
MEKVSVNINTHTHGRSGLLGGDVWKINGHIIQNLHRDFNLLHLKLNVFVRDINISWHSHRKYGSNTYFISGEYH